MIRPRTGALRRPIAGGALTVAIAAALALASLTLPARPVKAAFSARWQGAMTGPFTMGPGSAEGTSWPARTFYVYVPKTLRPAGDRSLVVYLHGTTQTAEAAANSAMWNDVADREGFLVAYPEESTASSTDGSNGARAWAWGRAAFESRENGEMRTIAEITRAVTAQYAVDSGRVFIGGISAGAIMSTVMAASYPDLYNGVASWAGCAYLCADANGDLGAQRMGAHRRVVPAILFAGSTDYLVNPAMSQAAISGWTGMNDLADDGVANGSVSRQPTEGPTTFGADAASLEPAPNTGPADGSRGTLGTCLFVTAPKGNNPCPGATLGWESYPYTVTRFGTKANPSSVVVESWYIHGVSHNYAGGSNEGTYADPVGPDTTTAAWRFLDAHARPAVKASIADAAVVEGKKGVRPLAFTISLSQPAGHGASVTYATRDGSATSGTDYVAGSGTVTFEPGATEATVTIDVLGDKRRELDETFFVDLVGSSGAVLQRATATGTILTDE